MKNLKNWRPKGIESLEKAAEEAVLNNGKNLLVTAGPGSGKTELLAQKACYLLENNLCGSSKRILAISFKKDSAKNLKDRVKNRIGEELSGRFDSFTFDAFAVNLLSRFRNGLPNKLRPSSEFEIEIWNDKNFSELINSLEGQKGLTLRELESLNREKLKNNYLCFSEVLMQKEKFSGIRNPYQTASELIWEKQLHKTGPSKISFDMVGALVEVILKKNPQILKALRNTYPYVFVDEFQDTTAFQYNFLKLCFKETESKITAVGDSKQKIMGWAGALDNIFELYSKEFNAEKKYLANNYRSAPNLVKFQREIMNYMNINHEPVHLSSNNGYSPDDGNLKIYFFKDEQKEAECLSELVGKLIDEKNLSPREICVLVRNKPENYTVHLMKALETNKIVARIESEYQDLLSEPLILLLLNFFKLVSKKRSPYDWKEIFDFFTEDLSSENIEQYSKREFELKNFINSLKKDYTNRVDLKDILKDILKFLDMDKIKIKFPQYKQKSYRNKILTSFYCKMSDFLKKESLEKAIKNFEGTYTVPIMTIHKSKGLEFKVVIFMGIEDRFFWNYQKDRDEINSFFVACSRAKEKLVFTYSEKRNGETSRIEKIRDFYEILEKAGIETVNISEQK